MKWSSVIVILYCIFSFSTGSNLHITVSSEVPKSNSGDQGPHESAFSENLDFYPSFGGFNNHPLGHSRPFYFNNQQQEGAYSQRSQPFQQRFDASDKFSGYKGEYTSDAPAAQQDTHGLLGSGNFGVIPGGTFYPDNDERASSSNFGEFDSYYHNGHGRPSFYFDKPAGSKQFKQQQFANFKDFADINVPNGGQYSQYVTVYVNKNASEGAKIENSDKKFRPKNIFESLALLDLESSTTSEPAPEKKLSKSKRKLSKLLPEKKWLVKKTSNTGSAKEMPEPLLALS